MSVFSNICCKKPNYKNRKKNVRNLTRRPAIAKKLSLLHGCFYYFYCIHKKCLLIGLFWLLTVLLLSKYNYLLYKNKQKEIL